MTWQIVAEMIGIAAVVCGGSIFIVGLMIKASIADATASIMREIHNVLDVRYVTKDQHASDITLLSVKLEQVKEGVEYLDGIITRTRT